MRTNIYIVFTFVSFASCNVIDRAIPIGSSLGNGGTGGSGGPGGNANGDGNGGAGGAGGKGGNGGEVNINSSGNSPITGNQARPALGIASLNPTTESPPPSTTEFDCELDFETTIAKFSAKPHKADKPTVSVVSTKEPPNSDKPTVPVVSTKEPPNSDKPTVPVVSTKKPPKKPKKKPQKHKKPNGFAFKGLFDSSEADDVFEREEEVNGVNGKAFGILFGKPFGPIDRPWLKPAPKPSPPSNPSFTHHINRADQKSSTPECLYEALKMK